MNDVLQQRNALESSDIGPRDTDDLELDLEDSSDTDAQAANGSNLATAKLSSKKKEALSQVPCKFFRSNGCSAGNACPFAHISPGEGQGKSVCQWFLKGSCRFGHKCALAHILPGQPMSMDRKNKRAAQHQQQNQNPGINGQAQQGQGQGQQLQYQQQKSQADQRQHSNLSSQRTFTSGRGLLPSTTSWEGGQIKYQEGTTSSHNAMPIMNNQHREGDLLFGVPDDLQAVNSGQSSSSMMPSMPMIGSFRSDRMNRMSQKGEDVDSSFLRSNDSTTDALGRTAGVAGVGNSMSTQAFGTSPFSHPGSHSVFYSHEVTRNRQSDESGGRADDRIRSQMANMGDSWPKSTGDTGNLSTDVNEEDFLPSSLSELLTPAELQRRSRSGLGAAQNPSTKGFTPQSMPARTVSTSSLWDSAAMQKQQWRLEQPNSWLREGDDLSLNNARERLVKDKAATTAASPSNSFLQPSISNLSISNVSAGFLGSRLRRGLGSGPADAMGSSAATTQTRPMDGYSPDSHAALSHAPGQSLPQGLAAGLSRLHLRADNHNEGGKSVWSQGEPTSTSNTSIWNHQGNGGISGYNAKMTLGGHQIDDLGPTAPSSIFAQKAPIHLGMNRSLGGSASTSLDALHQNHNYNGVASLSTSINGSGHVLSPYARSPANRMEGGIAIPSASTHLAEGAGLGNSINSSSSGAQNNNTNVKASHPSHPGMHRLRTAGTGIGSPLSLPTTGEEVEEPMFELE